MRRKKVCVLVTTLELGGAQQVAFDLAKSLSAAGFDVLFLSGGGGALESEVLSNRAVRLRLLKHLRRDINPLLDATAFVHLLLIFLKNRFDVVHTHSSKAGILGRLAAKLAGVPTVFHTVHGWSFNDYQPPLTRYLFISLERLAGLATNRFFTVCRADVAKGLRHRIGNRHLYTTVYCGVDTAHFQPAAESPTHNQDTGKMRACDSQCRKRPVVGTVMPLKPQKAPLDFIRVCGIVARSFPEARYVVVGDGVMRTACVKKAEELGIAQRTEFLGWRRDISDLMNAFDVFVLTSLWEGLPLTVLEAMAAGKPVVATRVDGVPEAVIHGVTGFLASPGDVDELAGYVMEVLQNPAWGIRMGAAAREIVEKNFRRDQYRARMIEYHLICRSWLNGMGAKSEPEQAVQVILGKEKFEI